MALNLNCSDLSISTDIDVTRFTLWDNLAAADIRSFDVSAEDRFFDIESEDRIFDVANEDRIFDV